MLNWNRIANPSQYENGRFELLRLLEGSSAAPYKDSLGVPTIGIGFNLRYHLGPVLSAIVGSGHESGVLSSRLQTEIDRYSVTGGSQGLRTALDGIMRDWHESHDSAVPVTFRFPDDQAIRHVVDALAPEFDDRIDAWVPAIPNGNERMALFSMTWNAPSLLGPKLRAAIESGNRAEAWYEIRYNSNGHDIPGIANRRYVEAETFGLYDRSDRITTAEALSAGRMMLHHHDEIHGYERSYDPLRAAEIKHMPGIGTITDALQPAIERLLANNRLHCEVPPEELLVASRTEPDIRGDRAGHDDTASNDDLLFGSAAVNHMWGGGGRDILVGGAGADILTGGRGADIFAFRKPSDSTSGRPDIVNDFRHGIDEIAFCGKLEADYALHERNACFSGEGPEIRWFWTPDFTRIAVDHDADGKADLAVMLRGHVNLSIHDFLV